MGGETAGWESGAGSTQSTEREQKIGEWREWDGGMVGGGGPLGPGQEPRSWGTSPGEPGTWLKASTSSFDSPPFCPPSASILGQTPFSLAYAPIPPPPASLAASHRPPLQNLSSNSCLSSPGPHPVPTGAPPGPEGRSEEPIRGTRPHQSGLGTRRLRCAGIAPNLPWPAELGRAGLGLNARELWSLGRSRAARGSATGRGHQQ